MNWTKLTEAKPIFQDIACAFVYYNNAHNAIDRSIISTWRQLHSERFYTHWCYLPTFDNEPEPKKSATRRRWYHVLQCGENSTSDYIKNMYRNLVKKYHPDGLTPNTALFLEVQAAYEEAQRLGKV
jgi:hypothetical protein